MATPSITATAQACASKLQRLRMVRTTILDNLGTDVTLVEQVMEHSVDGGKGLRALVAHISTDWCGLPRESCNIIAAAVEMIHVASLLHDDVVDSALLRRHRESANSVFGPSAAVLAGDFLYSRASQLLSQEGNLKLLAMIADATNQLAEGEVLQLVGKDSVPTEQEYYEIIQRKTASLFAASAMTGPLTASREDMLEPLRGFGTHLGLAFQIKDDSLDYAVAATDTGKDAGHDFSIGTTTLPLLRAQALANTKQKAQLKIAFANRTQDSAFATVLEIITATKALKSVQLEVEKQVAQAIDCLAELPDSPHRDMLSHMAQRTLMRRS